MNIILHLSEATPVRDPASPKVIITILKHFYN